LAGALVVGWLHARRPLFGRVPQAALSLLSSLGLSAFLAVVGIGAGPMFVVGLRRSGVPLLIAGVLVCAIPNIVTALAGYYVLKLHPGIVMGIRRRRRRVRTRGEAEFPLGYGSFAIGNILLALRFTHCRDGQTPVR
jgi:putative transport protein